MENDQNTAQSYRKTHGRQTGDRLTEPEGDRQLVTAGQSRAEQSRAARLSMPPTHQEKVDCRHSWRVTGIGGEGEGEGLGMGNSNSNSNSHGVT